MRVRWMRRRAGGGDGYIKAYALYAMEALGGADASGAVDAADAVGTMGVAGCGRCSGVTTSPQICCRYLCKIKLNIL